MTNEVVLFGEARVEALSTARVRWFRNARSVIDLAARGQIGALVLDARSAEGFYDAMELLRQLFDDSRHPARTLHPGRVIALVADGDTDAAFALGRYALACVMASKQLDALASRVERVRSTAFDAPPLSLEGPLRTARVSPPAPGEAPTVAIGFRHAPETLSLLDRYARALRARERECTVFGDVATLIDVLVNEGLTCQTNLATKAGAAHGGQYVGSFAFYRELRRTRYKHIVDPPNHEVDLDVWIVVDEVLHEVLHLLYLANELRATIAPTHTHVAEELSASWWQGAVHSAVFPSWLGDRHILEINYDFLLCEPNAEPSHFWKVGSVFEKYAGYPWVPYVLAKLPARASYIGARPDLDRLEANLRRRPEAAFLLTESRPTLRIGAPFDSYPAVPETLRVDD